MKKFICFSLFILGISNQAASQEKLLNPQNIFTNLNLLKSDTSKMSWSMVKDSIEISIGDIFTEIKNGKDSVTIITTVTMKQSSNNWVDSTIVETKNYKPIYHSSYNQQRDMVLQFGDKVTGYYLDKKSNIRTKISEEVDKPFFDSNFYPQLLRILPLKNGYSRTISIFDYNPKSNIGVITATIKSTEETTIKHHGKLKQVWKVETTDEISNNSAIITYYIDMITRKLLKQELDIGGIKMIMRLDE